MSSHIYDARGYVVADCFRYITLKYGASSGTAYIYNLTLHVQYYEDIQYLPLVQNLSLDQDKAYISTVLRWNIVLGINENFVEGYKVFRKDFKLGQKVNPIKYYYAKRDGWTQVARVDSQHTLSAVVDAPQSGYVAYFFVYPISSIDQQYLGNKNVNLNVISLGYDAPPSQPQISCDDQVVCSNVEFRYTITAAEDPDGQIKAYEVGWRYTDGQETVDNIITRQAAEGQNTATITPKGSTIVLFAAAIDEYDVVGQRSYSDPVIVNQPPNAPKNFRVDFSYPQTKSVLTWQAAQDSTGTVEAYRVDVYVRSKTQTSYTKRAQYGTAGLTLQVPVTGYERQSYIRYDLFAIDSFGEKSSAVSKIVRRNSRSGAVRNLAASPIVFENVLTITWDDPSTVSISGIDHYVVRVGSNTVQTSSRRVQIDGSLFERGSENTVSVYIVDRAGQNGAGTGLLSKVRRNSAPSVPQPVAVPTKSSTARSI